MTGFYRDGYCRVGAEDGGNHAVAGKSPGPPPPLPFFSLIPAGSLLTLSLPVQPL